MLHLQFYENNKVFESISKPTAKKFFEEKKELYWLANLANPLSCWNSPAYIDYKNEYMQNYTDFNSFYNELAGNLRWYGCKELGKTPRFYANAKDIQELKGR